VGYSSPSGTVIESARCTFIEVGAADDDHACGHEAEKERNERILEYHISAKISGLK
jgi:hypothetical protein